MVKKNELKQNFNTVLEWYCISCNKRVSQGDDKIRRKSFFIEVSPNNARICTDCLSTSISMGVN